MYEDLLVVLSSYEKVKVAVKKIIIDHHHIYLKIFIEKLYCIFLNEHFIRKN